MAKEQSFDVVSNVDMQEIDNAVQQASKELVQRYDLKDSGATIALDKAAATITVAAPADFVAKQVVDVLGTKLVRRGIDLKALDWGAPEAASGGSVRVTAAIVNGIEAELARRINKDIRDQKLKVKVQIEGDKLRVFSPKRDELQEVIAFLKDQDYGIPLQFTNYR
ncbi:MAG: YajQ family cyclic di-GMP-binding protein [Anaerosomatales bacterium]|nr:YajQ family cyclic di-GMP-binding protein [Anaerosomatales bacterium]MDT8433364.1 YajQ family cyclic di-GMP-binding protein [Anaerosomatales bacterium]